MNLKLVLISLPAVFLAFIFALSMFQPIPSNSILYTHEDLCREKSFLCIEKYKRAQNIQIDNILPELEKWVKSKNLIESNFLLHYDKILESIQLKAIKELKSGEEFFKIKRKDLLSIEALENIWFSNSMNETILKNAKDSLNQINVNLWEKCILVLAFHLRNIEESSLKLWLFSQPKSDTSLLTQLTPYEYWLLDYDAQLRVNETLLYLTNSYNALNYQIENKFPLDKFTLKEYFYVNFLVQKCGIWRKGSSNRVLVINPIEAFLKESNEENYEEQIRQFEKESMGFVEKMKTFKLTNQNEIIQKPINSQMDELDYFIQQGEIVKGCIQLSLVNPTQLKQMESKRKRMLQFLVDKNGESCLYPSMSAYSRLYLLGKILNLQDDKFDQCYTKFFEKELFSKDEEFQYKLQTLSQDCQETVWEIDPRAEVLNDLKKKNIREGQRIMKTKEYIKEREKSGKSVQNGKKILLFYEQKLDTMARLQLEIASKIQKMSNEHI